VKWALVTGMMTVMAGCGLDTSGLGSDGMDAATCDPVAEICDEADNDCDGTTDEGFMLDTDPRNCGVCGAICAPGQACNAGECFGGCARGQASCGGACVDLADDAANCGACGVRCTGGRVCAEGACGCPPSPAWGSKSRAHARARR